MPEKETVERAKKDLREGKKPTTAAGEFVREEMEHIREGKHGARSTKQAIAIGLSKARRAGVKLPSPPASAKSKTKQSAKYASRASRRGHTRPSGKRSRALLWTVTAALVTSVAICSSICFSCACTCVNCTRARATLASCELVPSGYEKFI